MASLGGLGLSNYHFQGLAKNIETTTVIIVGIIQI